MRWGSDSGRREGGGHGCALLTTAVPEAPSMSPPNCHFSRLIIPWGLIVSEKDFICMPFAPLVSLDEFNQGQNQVMAVPHGAQSGSRTTVSNRICGIYCEIRFYKM